MYIYKCSPADGHALLGPLIINLILTTTALYGSTQFQRVPGFGIRSE